MTEFGIGLNLNLVRTLIYIMVKGKNRKFLFELSIWELQQIRDAILLTITGNLLTIFVYLTQDVEKINIYLFFGIRSALFDHGV